MKLLEKKWFQIALKWLILGVFLIVVISWAMETQRLPEHLLLEIKKDHYVILRINNNIGATEPTTIIRYPREQ